MIVYSEEIHVDSKEMIYADLKLEQSLHNYLDFTTFFFTRTPEIRS